jgi:hypothetical protein
MSTPSLKKPIHKGQVTIWATITFALAWGIFAEVMLFFNREKDTGSLGRAYSPLLIPMLFKSYRSWQVLHIRLGASAGKRCIERKRGLGARCTHVALGISTISIYRYGSQCNRTLVRDVPGLYLNKPGAFQAA